MKKIVFFSILIAVSVLTLVYVSSQRDALKKEKEKTTIIESQSNSSLMDPSVQNEPKLVVADPISQKGASDFKLKVLSEPEGADVYLDSEKVGVTPFEISIPSESRKLKLALDAYEEYERQVPAAKDSEGDLVWKIQLKKAQPKKQIVYYSKEIAPFSIQLKAVPLGEFETSHEEDSDSLANIKVKYCRVLIPTDGVEKIWVRSVVGPFATKKKTLQALKNVKKKFPEAFLATKHNCIGDL